MPPSPRRWSWLWRATDQLAALDSTVVLVVLVAVLATGAGGILLSASGRPSALPTGSLTAGQPGASLDADKTPAADPGDLPLATPDATTTPGPTDGAAPTAAPTPTPEPKSRPPEELTGYVWPIVDARISSKFGPRGDGFVIIDGKRAHDGLDLATWCGDKIRAAHAGTVLYAGRKFDPYLGYSQPLGDFYDRISNLNSLPIVVVIDDGNGYRSVYVHLAEARVGAGDVVKAGQTIGFEGATGRATGCHLHYALIRMDGAWQDVAAEHVPFYPPAVRERVDPLLVFPLRDPDAPAKIRARYGEPVLPDLPFDPPPPAVGGV